MNNVKYSRYFYKPKKRKKKLILILLLFFLLIGGAVYSLFFLDASSIASRLVTTYRLLFNDFRFIERNLEEGNYTVVINDGGPLLSKKPYDPRLLRYLGEAYYYISSNLTGQEKDETLAQAIRLLRKSMVLSEGGTIPRYYFILGMAYFERGIKYYELAAMYLTDAIKSGYVDKKSYEIIGLCYYRLKAYDSAISYFKKAMEVSKKDITRLFLASSYKEKGMFESAAKEFDYLIKNTDDDAIREEAFSQSAWIDFKEERYEDAKKKLIKVLEIDSNSDFAHYLMGNIYEKEGDIISARKEWRTALRINPKNIDAIKKLY